MTQQEIQQLIGRYLDGETTPEEELMLAQELPEGHPIRMMLGELALGEAEYDRIMESRQPKARTIKMSWRWAASIIAVAASIALLFIFSHRATENTKPQQELIAQQSPSLQGEDAQQLPSHVEEESVTPNSLVEENIQTPPPTLEGRGKTTTTSAMLHENKSPRREVAVALPDTLGEGIWQNKENVRLALQMLAECEATIQREEQEIRNNIVRATFNATPQPANAILVTNELGDYEVIETRTIIEI